MTGQELINCFRELAQDRVVPYLWSDDWILEQLNEGEREACDRARLLFDDSTPAVTRLDVKAGQTRYAIHPKIIDIQNAFFVQLGIGTPLHLAILDRRELDWRQTREWRSQRGVPNALIHDGDCSVTLAPPPSVDGQLRLEAYRLPVEDFALGSDPEIAEQHQRNLVSWALFRAYSIPDADGQNQQLAALYHDRFEGYFGRGIDARKRRFQRANQPHANKLW